MNSSYDEVAFFNRQLAVMLREGIPLEGALKQLTQDMRGGAFRDGLVKLEEQLRQGRPLREALPKAGLPLLYAQLLDAGVRGNDLPGMLTLLADYYQRANALFTRLRGLMVYPVIVVVVALGLTLMITLLLSRTVAEGALGIAPAPPLLWAMWVAPCALALVAGVVVALVSAAPVRRWCRWRLPGFREASLARLASAMALMLRSGASLPDVLLMAEGLEAGTPVGREMARWREQVAQGRGSPSQWTTAGATLPPLFLWLVRGSGEDLAAGFQKAADLYETRANYRIEMALYGALPVSILLLGHVVLWQIAPVFQVFTQMMRSLGSME